MSQFDFPLIDPEVTSGTELAAYLNNWVPAMQSSHAGGARPTYAEQGMLWIDTSGGAGNWLLKAFDGADDVTIGRIDSLANGFTPSVGNKSAATTDDAIAYAIALG